MLMLRLSWKCQNVSAPSALWPTALLELQSHFGDNPVKFQVVCPQNRTAVLLEYLLQVLHKLRIALIATITEGFRLLPIQAKFC